MMFILKYFLFVITIGFSLSTVSQEVGQKSMEFGAQEENLAAEEVTSTVHEISREIQGLKNDVVALNTNLRLMEEELLFPSSTQYSVYVSLNVGKYFALESIKLKFDGKTVTTHLYSPRQRESLSRGGVQKLYMTNLNEGKHIVSAFFTGIGPNGRDYKRAKNFEFMKGKGSQHMEISIVDDEASQEPLFNIKQW